MVLVGAGDAAFDVSVFGTGGVAFAFDAEADGVAPTLACGAELGAGLLGSKPNQPLEVGGQIMIPTL